MQLHRTGTPGLCDSAEQPASNGSTRVWCASPQVRCTEQEHPVLALLCRTGTPDFCAFRCAHCTKRKQWQHTQVLRKYRVLPFSATDGAPKNLVVRARIKLFFFNQKSPFFFYHKNPARFRAFFGQVRGFFW